MWSDGGTRDEMGGTHMMNHRVTAMETMANQVAAVRATDWWNPRIEAEHFISTMSLAARSSRVDQRLRRDRRRGRADLPRLRSCRARSRPQQSLSGQLDYVHTPGVQVGRIRIQ